MKTDALAPKSPSVEEPSDATDGAATASRLATAVVTPAALASIAASSGSTADSLTVVMLVDMEDTVEEKPSSAVVLLLLREVVRRRRGVDLGLAPPLLLTLYSELALSVSSELMEAIPESWEGKTRISLLLKVMLIKVQSSQREYEDSPEHIIILVSYVTFHSSDSPDFN